MSTLATGGAFFLVSRIARSCTGWRGTGCGGRRPLPCPRRAAASWKNLSEISLDKHREPPPVGPAGVFSLFPAEEAEGEEGAACFAIFRHE